MGLHKRYDGYKSFQYLEGGKDYKPFKLAKEVNRVRPYIVPVSRKEEETTQKILGKHVAISLHDHTNVHPEKIDEVFDYVRADRIATGYEGLSVSGLDAVFDGMLDGTNKVVANYPWNWESIVHEIGMRLSDIAHQDFIIKGERVKDIERAHREGKLAFIIHMEGAAMIENQLDRVDVLYGLGVRAMGLVYSETNSIGAGLREKNDAGLSNFGYQVVERMNRLGMAVDVAHCGDKTSLDAIEASKLPIFVTHAGARGLWPTKRMKPDEVIEALAEKGGVFGIEAAPHTTLTEKNRRHNIHGIMEHFQYVERLVGIDHVSFGPDTLFGDHVALHHLFARELSVKEAHVGLQFDEVPYVRGLENPSEFPNVVRWLVKNGYSESSIAKAIGGNTLRVLKQVWK